MPSWSVTSDIPNLLSLSYLQVCLTGPDAGEVPEPATIKTAYVMLPLPSVPHRGQANHTLNGKTVLI